MASLHSITLKDVVEALLFAAPKPISIREIRAALQAASEFGDDREMAAALATASGGEILAAIRELCADYEQDRRSFRLFERAGGWQIATLRDFAPWVRQLFPELRPARLSTAAMETLAIIAYRGPLTRGEVEAVRGVSVDGVLQTLLDRNLVKIAGRAEAPGRSLLYETTVYFLEHFGLRSLKELPNSHELGKMLLPKRERAEATGAS